MATKKLIKSNITSARLDSELILAHCIEKERTYLHAHIDDLLDNPDLKKANIMLKKRQKMYPIAYLVGKKEFYNRLFLVNRHTLIPRPESESIIDFLKSLPLNKNPKIVDVGCGSGCLGISASLEIPRSDITLVDIKKSALKSALKNCKVYDLKPSIFKSNLLYRVPGKFDVIIANLPYVDKSWSTSPETRYEPKVALFAKDNGLHLIKKLIDQTNTSLNADGYIILEADPRQHKQIINYAKLKSLNLIKQNDFILAFKKSK